MVNMADGSGTPVTMPITLPVTPGSRYEKSLGLLTTRFVSLLQKAKDGVLDLKESFLALQAADILAVRQKRRIYDITNVLEGIGLIEKKTKNAIQWKGASPGTNTEEFVARVERLKEEVRRLDQIEKDMDKHRQWLEQSLRNITEEPGNARYAYIRQEDICTAFPDQTILALKIPKDTQMDFPPGEKMGDQTKYKIHMKAAKEPIHGYLVNPELEPPSVIVDFPENYQEWLNKKSDISEEETQKIEDDKPVVSTRSTRSRAAGSASPSKLPEPGSSSPRKISSSGIDASLAKGGSVVSTRRQGKRQAPGGPSEEEPKMKMERKDEDLEGLDQHADLITVNQSDIDQHVEVVTTTENEEDDVAAELPDGFYSTSLVGPILRLSPPPTEQDYRFTLAKHEGLFELYDIRRANHPPTTVNISTTISS